LSGSHSRLPSLTGGASRASNLPQTVDERVDIRDLTWEDRERVLRLLFAKINSTSSYHGMSANTLQEITQEGAADEAGQTLASSAFFVTQPTYA